MKLINFLCVLMMLVTTNAFGQWTVGAGIGLANPISGYKTITNNGPLLQFDFQRRLQNHRWTVGLFLGWARMHNDNNAADPFQEARLDQIPILVTGNFALTDSNIVPYLGLGLGISLYNLSYDTSPTTGESTFNASFSIMPRAGLKYKINDQLSPFLDVSLPFVMDGPPPGSGESDKATGYLGIAAGLLFQL